MGLQVYLHTVKMRVVCVHAYRVAGLSLSFQYLEDTLKDSRARILIFFLCHGRPPSFLLTIFVSSRVEGLPIMCRITTPKMYQQRCIQQKEPIQISKTFPSCKGCLFTCIILFFSFFASLCIDPVLSWSSVLYVCTRSLLWLLRSFLYGHAYCFVFFFVEGSWLNYRIFLSSQEEFESHQSIEVSVTLMTIFYAFILLLLSLKVCSLLCSVAMQKCY